jgi:hypothetical protein
MPAFQLSALPEHRRAIISVLQISFFSVVGAAPVLSIPIHTMGAVDIHDTARFFVVPATIIVVALFFTKSAESVWALRGLIAGLVAVTAYDALRLPFALAGVWPDFIPRLGGWISSAAGENFLIGYLWRYPGDGGGMGVVFFLVCAIAGITPESKLGKHVITLGVGYGVFIWSGLIATVTLIDAASTMIFRATPTLLVLSLLGHLVYGSVLGYCYRWVVARTGEARDRTPMVPAQGASTGQG